MQTNLNSGTGRLALHGSIAFAAVAAVFQATSVHAQVAPPTNVVSVCSGVSLPRSVVTDIIRPVIGGVVTPIQGTVNPILGVVGGVLPLVPPLSIDADGLLDAAAAGQPIRLQVLNTNGTLVGPGDPCEAQADSISLLTPAGLSIGGNRITGLGAAGQEAFAGTVDGIAFGNLARTDATSAGAIAIGSGAAVDANAPGSVALGIGSRVSAADSVAIGSGSIATRGIREFSVGAAGAERVITNVAAGTATTDAANVGQVAAVSDQVTALADRAVLYDAGTTARVTLAGPTGTVIANVAPGTLSAVSTEAVNGAQLFATNQQVGTNTTAITNLTTQITNVANGGAGPVRYSDAATPTVPNAGIATNEVTLVGAAPGPVGLHNVAAGSVTAGSTDAVNGGQLAATNVRIDDAVDAIAAVNTQVTNNINAIVDVDARVTGNTTAITANTTAISNLDTRVTNNTTAVTDLDARVTNNSTAIANLSNQAGANATAITNVDARVTAVDARVTDVDAKVTAVDARVTDLSVDVANNATAITNLGNQITNGAIGPVRYSDAGTPETPNGGAPTNDLTLIGAAPGAVGLHNVAAGRVAAGSTDAVNGGQLASVAATAANAVAYDTDASGVRTNTVTLAGGDATQSVRVTNVAAGSIVNGSSDAVNGGQLANTNAAVTRAQGTADTAITRAATAQTTADAAGTAAAQARGVADNALALGRNSIQYDTDGAAVTLNPGGSAVTVRNMAAGVAATDGVNVEQLGRGLRQTLADANAYTDMRISEIGFDLKEVRRDTFGGTATALAAAGLPQAYEAGAGMFSLGGGTYQGESAIAVGFSKAFNDGHTVVKFSGSRDTRGRTGVSGGVGYQF